MKGVYFFLSENDTIIFRSLKTKVKIRDQKLYSYFLGKYLIKPKEINFIKKNEIPPTLLSVLGFKEEDLNKKTQNNTNNSTEIYRKIIDKSKYPLNKIDEKLIEYIDLEKLGIQNCTINLIKGEKVININVDEYLRKLSLDSGEDHIRLDWNHLNWNEKVKISNECVNQKKELSHLYSEITYSKSPQYNEAYLFKEDPKQSMIFVGEDILEVTQSIITYLVNKNTKLICANSRKQAEKFLRKNQLSVQKQKMKRYTEILEGFDVYKYLHQDSHEYYLEMFFGVNKVYSELFNDLDDLNTRKSKVIDLIRNQLQIQQPNKLKIIWNYDVFNRNVYKNNWEVFSNDKLKKLNLKLYNERTISN
ncbi:hypothetical protein [Dolosigranulum pigrum]|uniref:hypothetical protein n=1 Tax=Dolosigranulum pigrum TaxID=29394 RepID=UPI001AD880A2|nr:hypothetical protein [Dolosigranulum pigrum]QTJ37716.1 hypothetical protein FE324_02590 [Dolosigranulum pigrum]QTJ45606.1 hypothetical protein FE328_08715 [Dolosigranulum pigrum]